MLIQLSTENARDFEIHCDHESIEMRGNEFEGQLSADGIDICGSIKRINKSKLNLRFTLTGRILYPCARCLEYVPIDAEYHYDEDIELTEDTDTVNLVPFIEECLFINEPFKVLCDEDCKGLCPGCGVNLNRENCQCDQTDDIDPRFEALKQLLQRNTEQEVNNNGCTET